MIPTRLTVKNFMCYRDGVPPLVLDGIHVACLCGGNGHGKSALLDAITWALWGESRARTQEELIHQGRRDMAVELEFMARGQRYRVSRRYSRSAGGRQGTTLLEIQVASENGLRPITGNTVRDSEARIRDIVHMDYDTFVNTAFLLQGRADMFTRSSPAARKECLAEVLDLSHYQALEERAKEQGRVARDGAREAEGAISLRRQEVARKGDYEQEFAAVGITLDQVTPEVDAHRLKVESLQKTVASLSQRTGEMQTFAERIEAGEAEVSDLFRQKKLYESRVADYGAALQREPEIREQHALLEEARAELERYNSALAGTSEMEANKAHLEREIAVQQERLTGQLAQLRNTITNGLEPAADRLPQIEEALNTASLEEAKLAQGDDALRQQRNEAQDTSAKLRYLEETNSGLVKGMGETRKKFDMLDQDNAECPLCRQPLGAEGQDHLRREYETQGRESKRLYEENTSEQERLKRDHSLLLNRVLGRENELNTRRQDLQSGRATLERDKEDSRRSQDQLQPALAELEDVESRLGGENFAVEERRRLARLREEISALGYDGEKHHRRQQDVKELEPFAELHRKLLEAVEALPAEREALETASQMLDRRRTEIGQDERRRDDLARELESLPSREAELANATSRYRALDRQKQEALVRKGVMVEQIERLSRLESELKELEKGRLALVDRKAVYDELAVAFGKNGVQALIIETAIPQLQDDANELLGRLTEGRMFLKLQIQEGRRERRMGLPSEELDIQISDEVGTRSYETFSGGEAFRIDFALRIALSKLLARRSGAPLPILFIDEGFGSQDSAGQERLKEAIHSIQSDFQKIIVITHVEEVKDSFPTRIEVTKTSAGSTFTVV